MSVCPCDFSRHAGFDSESEGTGSPQITGRLAGWPSTAAVACPCNGVHRGD
jgi:hypothetical protein